jgi:hypothetical protein
MGIIKIFTEILYAPLSVQVFTHTDSFTVFIIEFDVGNKAILFIKGTDALIIFNVSVQGKKTAGEK